MKREKETEIEVEDIGYEPKTGDYRVQKNKRFYWVAFVFCIIVSVCIWAYALNVNDPMIEKTLIIKYEYVGFDTNEVPTAEFDTVKVYGTKSSLEKVAYIKSEVSKSEFGTGKKIEKNLTFPDGVKPVSKDDNTVSILLSK